MSVYANALDVLKSIDLAYDGAKTSMEIGRPRIGVSGNMLQTDMLSGEMYTVFDPCDIAVYDLGMFEDKPDVFVKDLTTPYRAEDFERSLQTQLQIYSQAIGLGEKAFHWNTNGVKTATEVIAENATMLRTMRKHQSVIRVCVADVCRAVLDALGENTRQDIQVVFDDASARNRELEGRQAWQWVQAGKYPFWQYLVRYQGYDENEAKAIQAEAASGAAVFGEE
jgi:A118 family predicted phage portal protein